MTTRYEQAMARIEEDARKFQRVMIGAGNCTYEEALAFRSGAKAFDVLKDVLELPTAKRPESIHATDWDVGVANGYNIALQDVAEKIIEGVLK